MVEIKALIVDSREKPNVITTLQKTIMERRETSGLGSRLTLPHEDVLEHGDFMIEYTEEHVLTDSFGVKCTVKPDRTIVIERKTISDALGNWQTSKRTSQASGHAKNRFDIQAFDMLNWDRCDWAMMLVEDCYEPKKLLQNPTYQSHKASFLQHLNSMADSAMPVIRTRSLKDTCIYISHLCERILKGDFMTFKRPVELIDMGDRIVTMLCSLPDVGVELAKRIKAVFVDMDDPLEAFSKACREHLNIVIEVNGKGMSKAKGQRDSPLCQIEGIGWTKAFVIADAVCNWTK